jgi:hypothetical protein
MYRKYVRHAYTWVIHHLEGSEKSAFLARNTRIHINTQKYTILCQIGVCTPE